MTLSMVCQASLHIFHSVPTLLFLISVSWQMYFIMYSFKQRAKWESTQYPAFSFLNALCFGEAG